MSAIFSTLSPLYEPQNGGVFQRNIFEPEGRSAFYIETWYPDAQFLEKEITRRGNIISVLNAYVPGALNAGEGAAFYLNFRKLVNLAIGSDFIAEREIIPLWGKVQVRADYDKFFLTWYPTPITITQATWTWSLDEQLSTPLMLAVGDDIRIDDTDFYTNKSFRYGFTASIPANAGTSIIDIEHGYEAKDLIAVISVTSAVNPLTVTISQRLHRGNMQIDDVTLNPSLYPYTSTHALPRRNSPMTRFTIQGGGAAEAGQISFSLILTPI